MNHYWIKIVTLLVLFLVLLASPINADAQDRETKQPTRPVVFRPDRKIDNIEYLMAASATRNQGKPPYNSPPKHFWMSGLKSGASFQWKVQLDKAAAYHLDALIDAPKGTRITLTSISMNPENKGRQVDTTTVTKSFNGWDKQDCGVLRIPAGSSVITWKLVSGDNVSFKSLELVRNTDYPALLKRVADFRANTDWLSRSKYGIMLQFGSWGYPRIGKKRDLEAMARDFDVPGFVKQVKEMGAAYVVFSITWWDYKIMAPIKSVDAIVGHSKNTSQRDVLGELAKALKKEDIRVIFYYHIGQDSHKGLGKADWWRAQKFPNKEFADWGRADRSVFMKNWATVVKEIGNRYGKLLDGWFFDDGLSYYPAPFEKLGQAAKAGNPDRLISYNHWIGARYTDFQEVEFGEEERAAMHTGSAPAGGNGIYTKGNHKGLLQHGMFMLENHWGIYMANQTVRLRFTGPQLKNMVESASKRNVPLSINMVMWDGGEFHQPSVKIMKELKKAIREK